MRRLQGNCASEPALAPADLCHPKCRRWFVAHCLLFSHDYLKRGVRLHTSFWSKFMFFINSTIICDRLFNIHSCIALLGFRPWFWFDVCRLSTLDSASFFTNEIRTRKFRSENQMDCRWNGYIPLSAESTYTTWCVRVERYTEMFANMHLSSAAMRHNCAQFSNRT